MDASYKTPKNVIYRLTGVDGEVSENRIEQLQDENDLEMNDEKKYALAKTLSHILPNDQSGLSILFTDFSNIESVKKDAHLLSWYLPIFKLALKIKGNLKGNIRINGDDILVERLFCHTKQTKVNNC